MPRPTDRDRLLWLLVEQDGISNAQARTALQLDDARFAKIKTALIHEGLIEVFRRRGGGLRLTQKGLKEKPSSLPVSEVENEKALYVPFARALEAEANENGEKALVVDTSSLRKSGKWSNPDLIRVSVRDFPLVRTKKVVVSTFEVKQFGRWNIEAAFEAASHRRFAHHSHVVVEWSKELPLEGLDDLKQVCGRFGVGLITLTTHYRHWRHAIALEAESHVPPDEALEEFLGYVFERKAECKVAFDELWKATG